MSGDVTTGRDEPRRYEIRVNGHLAAHWAAWFDGLTLVTEDGGTTALRGDVVDDAALHGLLRKVRDTGLRLVSVTQIDAEPPPRTARRDDP
jgi:hypothetical protein